MKSPSTPDISIPPEPPKPRVDMRSFASEETKPDEKPLKPPKVLPEPEALIDDELL